MDLPSKAVWDVLSDNGIESLYHANSVVTSCQFLRAQALLSRGNVERLRQVQTPQSSDAKDKLHGVWFDVFADPRDIHRRASNVNLYGPVMFVLDIRCLRRTYTGRIWVTKLNPTKWAGRPKEERWFQSKKDLQQNFDEFSFDQMVVFRHCGGALPLGDCVRMITLDNPGLKNGAADLFSVGFGALSLALSDAGLDIPLKMRRCKPGCKCKATYSTHPSRTDVMFIP